MKLYEKEWFLWLVEILAVLLAKAGQRVTAESAGDRVVLTAEVDQDQLHRNSLFRSNPLSGPTSPDLIQGNSQAILAWLRAGNDGPSDIHEGS